VPAATLLRTRTAIQEWRRMRAVHAKGICTLYVITAFRSGILADLWKIYKRGSLHHRTLVTSQDKRFDAGFYTILANLLTRRGSRPPPMREYLGSEQFQY
jgi:hypothetical protein